MLGPHNVNLFDRIKETSYTLGTSNFVLNGAVGGFSSFGSVYANNSNLFYAATDGTFYEVGSGVYLSGVQNTLVRFPFRSSNNNNKVNFGEGLKEIFVTYPATNCVFTASGIESINAPQSSGIPFWVSSNALNYSTNLIWNNTNSRLGIKKTNPSYAIDIGGSVTESLIRSSGIIAGPSGLIFPSGNTDPSYFGGTQLTHYESNQLNSTTGSDDVLELSGIAQNHILLKKQNAGFVFAGPASGCTPPCSPDYPTFRPLLAEDIGDLDLTVLDTGINIRPKLGVNTSRLDGRVTSYTNEFDPNANSGWLKASYTASGLYGGGISLIDTVNASLTGQFGYQFYTTEAGTNLNIKMGSPSGIGQHVLMFDTNNQSGILASTMDFYGQKLRIRNSKTPPSVSAVGNSGDICWDSGYIYVCVAPNSWKRATLATW